MKVRELIAHLSGFDPELRVFVKGYEGGWNDAPAPRLTRIALGAGGGGICGDHEEYEDDEQFEFHDPKPEVISGVVIPRYER